MLMYTQARRSEVRVADDTKKGAASATRGREPRICIGLEGSSAPRQASRSSGTLSPPLALGDECFLFGYDHTGQFSVRDSNEEAAVITLG